MSKESLTLLAVGRTIEKLRSFLKKDPGSKIYYTHYDDILNQLLCNISSITKKDINNFSGE